MANLLRRKSYGFNARRAHRSFDRLLNHYLSSFGLKTGYWYYLRLLWVQDGLSQRELSEANNVAENTTALTLSAMQRDGLIYRERDPADGRRWHVYLTDDARALQGRLVPFAERVNDLGADGISTADLATWLEVTTKMSENLEKAFKEATNRVETVAD